MEKFDHYTNEMLILALQKDIHNEIIFRLLVQRFMPLFKKVAYSVTIEGCSPEDIIQEGMLQLYLSIQRFDPKMGPYFAPYFACVYRNYVYNLIRADKRRKKGNELTEASFQHESMSEADKNAKNTSICSNYRMQESPEAQFIVQEDSQYFVESLSPLEYEVMHYYVDENLKTREIAERKGMDRNQVRHAIRRAKDKLKKIINN